MYIYINKFLILSEVFYCLTISSQVKSTFHSLNAFFEFPFQFFSTLLKRESAWSKTNPILFFV